MGCCASIEDAIEDAIVAATITRVAARTAGWRVQWTVRHFDVPALRPAAPDAVAGRWACGEPPLHRAPFFILHDGGDGTHIVCRACAASAVRELVLCTTKLMAMFLVHVPPVIPAQWPCPVVGCRVPLDLRVAVAMAKAVGAAAEHIHSLCRAALASDAEWLPLYRFRCTHEAPSCPNLFRLRIHTDLVPALDAPVRRLRLAGADLVDAWHRAHRRAVVSGAAADDPPFHESMDGAATRTVMIAFIHAGARLTCLATHALGVGSHESLRECTMPCGHRCAGLAPLLVPALAYREFVSGEFMRTAGGRLLRWPVCITRYTTARSVARYAKVGLVCTTHIATTCDFQIQ